MSYVPAEKPSGPENKIEELVRQLGLQEDGEHVIIPFTGSDGIRKRCFLLKRRFIRIVYPDGYYLDIPLAAAIEATMKHPELPLSESIMITQRELVMRKKRSGEIPDGKETEVDGPASTT